MISSVGLPFYPYHFIRTILSGPFCSLPFCPRAVITFLCYASNHSAVCVGLNIKRQNMTIAYVLQVWVRWWTSAETSESFLCRHTWHNIMWRRMQTKSHMQPSNDYIRQLPLLPRNICVYKSFILNDPNTWMAVFCCRHAVRCCTSPDLKSRAAYILCVI